MAGGFPSPDEVFEDRYRIVSVINRGGFGRVYRALQTELNRDVAIKVLQPIMRDGIDEHEEASRLDIVRRRFEREAQLVSQLRDSHTVMMHDYGTTADGLLYMVLEYVDGKPLSQLIEDEGALAPDRAVKIARQVLWSLQEAHALNMLHRDVKPQNIMVFNHAGRTDQVKVLDFGLAKSAESAEFRAEDPDLTGDQVILGTPRYMSPEQIRGERLTTSTDMYSLGLVMFEMLAGYKAVGGESTMNTLARHLNSVPIVLPEDIEIPAGLRDIVNRMLVKDRDERLQSAEAVLDALEFWDASTSVLGAASDPLATAPALVLERRRQTLVWTIMAVLSLVLVIAVISAAMRDDGGAQATEIVNRAADPAALVPKPNTPRRTVVDFAEAEEVKVDDPQKTGTEVAQAERKKEPVEPVDSEEPPGEEPPAEAPDAGGPAQVIVLDLGVLEPAYPEPAEPTKPEKKSTKLPKSSKKKIKLDIGILN